MPVTSDTTLFYIVKIIVKRHGYQPAYEVRVMPVEPNPNYTIEELNLSREDAFPLCQQLEEQDAGTVT